jgi:hypothetical protein
MSRSGIECNRRCRLREFTVALLTLSTCALTHGCSPSARDGTIAGSAEKTGAPDEHEHEHEHGHEHATRMSYGEAVARIGEYRAAVASAFDASTPDACHDALHEAIELLTRFPEIAADTDLDRADWESARDAAQDVLAGFQQVDASLHRPDQAFAVNESLSRIDAGLAVLDKLKSETGEAMPSSVVPGEIAAESMDEHEEEHADGKVREEQSDAENES